MKLNGLDFFCTPRFLGRMHPFPSDSMFTRQMRLLRRGAILSAVSAGLFSLAACASASAGIATSNIPIGNREYEILGTAETTVSWSTFDIGILGMPLEPPPVDQAVQKLLAEKGGDALINLRYSTDRSIYLFITRHRFFLKADVVKLRTPPAKR